MLNIKEVDERGWDGLQWAVVNGHAEVVKILLEKYDDVKNESINEQMKQKLNDEISHNKNDFDEIFRKPPNPRDYGKYNPLHWAAYKGHSLITSILLKHSYNPLDIDNVGNTALHQAAASNNLEVFKIFMGLGIDLEVTNARSHIASDLTSDKEIKALIEKTLSVKKCQICSREFDFFIKRYLCAIKNEVICKNCCVSDFFYEHKNSKERNLIECRCKNCYNFILENESNVKNAIKSNSLTELSEVYNYVKQNNIKICCKLSAEAEFNIDRLQREKKIIEHLNNLKVVENHKTIEKSVFILEEMIKEAKDKSIGLDMIVVEKTFSEKNRLLAEKELRKLMSNLTVELSSPDNLFILNDKILNAKMSGVEEKYIETALELSKKIQLNLAAKELLELFVAYPLREYPKIEPIDPKKSKFLIINNFNIEKKPEPQPKKRRKKEPPFLIPEWAKELKTLVDKVQEHKGYLNISNEIGLDINFINKSKEHLSRMGQEIAFRRHEEEVLKKLEEDKKKKKRR